MSESGLPPPISQPSIPVIGVYRNSSSVSNGSSFNLGSFQQGTTQSFVFSIKNDGGDNLVFPQNGIISYGQTSISSNPTSGQSLVIAPAESVSVTVQINTSTAGSYGNQLIVLSSNSYINSSFSIYLSFTITALPSPPPPPPPSSSPPPPAPPAATPPTLSVSRIGSQIIPNNTTLSLASIAKDSSISVVLEFKNNGSSNLSITNVSVSGDATYDSSVFQSTKNLSYLSSAYLTLTLDATSLGNKRITVIISSNDTANNPYRISLTYVVAPQANVQITENNISVADGSVIPLGLVNKGTNPTKTYTLRNSGVSRNVTINSISASGDIVLSNNSSMPFTLRPNSANFLIFTISFPSDTVGQKSGTLSIDWS